jgi:hypothetical protein
VQFVVGGYKLYSQLELGMRCPNCAPKGLENPRWVPGRCDKCKKDGFVTKDPLEIFDMLFHEKA